MTQGVKGPWTPKEEYFRDQLTAMTKSPENQECADCSSKAPRWAVFNHGIFVCIKCSGQHRNLGTDISQVRSINLDRWKQHQFDQMIGNAKANEILLYNLPKGMKKPSEEDDYNRQKWIYQKYVARKWAKREDQQEPQSESSEPQKVKKLVAPTAQQVQYTQKPETPKKVEAQKVNIDKLKEQAQHQQMQVLIQPQQPTTVDIFDLINPSALKQPQQQQTKPQTPQVPQTKAQQPQSDVIRPNQNANAQHKQQQQQIHNQHVQEFQQKQVKMEMKEIEQNQKDQIQLSKKEIQEVKQQQANAIPQQQSILKQQQQAYLEALQPGLFDDIMVLYEKKQTDDLFDLQPQQSKVAEQKPKQPTVNANQQQNIPPPKKEKQEFDMAQFINQEKGTEQQTAFLYKPKEFQW